jgi:hypothetical protein
MFPTIRESAAVVSIILLLMLFLPSRLASRYRRPIVVVALLVEGDRLHTGGEFKRVSGVTQTSYARLSPASP